MARLQFPWRRTPPPAPAPPPKTVVVGATRDRYDYKLTFDNRNITSQTVLSEYDFDKILRDK